ncbi:MAG TPA: class IV adenylate cyclase [Tepidisphaeraceae bacterium]|nr:class IV adenylate cyclase [Tepidisphaeraceae bacterium]
MAVEIEAKMAVKDVAAVRVRIKECGATRLGAYAEVNTFFDTDDRSLLAADKGLRLRLKRNLETGEEDHIITYKGPRQPGPLKSREEVELNVEGSAETIKLFESLGFAKTLSFEKRRESWLMDHCQIELDELPYIGNYVEIEGPDEQAVLRVRKTLNLSDRELIKYGYVAILTGYLTEHRIPQRDIRFTA